MLVVGYPFTGSAVDAMRTRAMVDTTRFQGSVRSWREEGLRSDRDNRAPSILQSCLPRS